MGMTIWVLSEDKFEDDRDHSLILKHKKPLDKIAKQTGVTNLSAFYDNSILEEEFGSESESSYSAAEEVEKSLRSIINAINEMPAEKLSSVGCLIDELEDCLKKITIAKENNKNVRIAIIP